MPKISELSKDELLGIIYSYLPNTRFNEHPCYCALCAKDYTRELVTMDDGKTVKAIHYICDDCEKACKVLEWCPIC